MQNNSPDNEGLHFAQFGYGETVFRPLRANPFLLSDENQEHFKNVVITAIENGWQLNEHSAREVKVRAVLDIMEEIAETHPQLLDMRFTLAHTDGISAESIERAMALGMIFATHSSSRSITTETHEAGHKPPPIGTINDMGGIWAVSYTHLTLPTIYSV